jgi:hypothetical protein
VQSWGRLWISWDFVIGKIGKFRAACGVARAAILEAVQITKLPDCKFTRSLGFVDSYVQVGDVGFSIDGHTGAGLRADHDPATGGVAQPEAYTLQLSQLLDLDAIQDDVHPIQFPLDTVEVDLTQSHGTIQVGLMFRHDPFDFRLLAGQELVVHRKFLATGQNSGHGQSLLGFGCDLTKDGFGAVRNSMGERQMTFLVFTVQSQREDAECDPIEGFVVHDVLPALFALDGWGGKRSTRQNRWLVIGD